MGISCGIVGLPNVGKSTLFNALTATVSAEAANYPFCTIEPNVNTIIVPDKRLDVLAKIAGSAKIIPTTIELVDIAGLVEGASKGEGLGNQFLGNIREVDAIIHVLRCFKDDNITHVSGNIDPLRDYGIIETELMLADLQSLDKRVASIEKKAKQGDELSKKQLVIIQKIRELLDNTILPYGTIDCSSDEIKQLQLLTTKPQLIVCNVGESDVVSGNSYTKKVAEFLVSKNIPHIMISSKIESEIALMEDKDEQKSFLEMLGLAETGLDSLVHSAYHLLNLISFFTVGPKETHAWTIHRGINACESAGVIHTDFSKGFIRAETIAYDDYIKYNGEVGAKEAGKLRLEGKEYIVKDGDVMHFRFNL